MALCHDERDFAMGFSRHDPHASQHQTVEERRGAEKRRRYLESLPPDQKEAHERVEFCLQAVGQYFVAKGEMTPIFLGNLHQHFPAFAQRMGYNGQLYISENGRCPAISLSFPESDGSVWFITPYLSYDRLDEEGRKLVQTDTARRAALSFCEEWLPDWNWGN